MSNRSVLEDVNEWLGAGNVGEYVIIQNHMRQVSAGVEQVYKMHELPKEIVEAITKITKYFHPMHMEIICKSTGPDRVKVFAVRG